MHISDVEISEWVTKCPTKQLLVINELLTEAEKRGEPASKKGEFLFQQLY